MNTAMQIIMNSQYSEFQETLLTLELCRAAANPATVLALLDELEAAEKRIAELEAREVRIALPHELTAEDCDVLARPLDYGTGWNLAISACEEAFIHAMKSSGIRINGEG